METRTIINNMTDSGVQKFSPESDDAFVKDTKTGITEAAGRNEEDFLVFIQKNIQMMNDKLLFNGNREPSLYELDMALANYEQSLFSLQALYAEAKYEADIAKAKFEEFYAEKYMEIRNKYNTIDVKKAQWLSAGEMEYTTKSVYKTELAALKMDQIDKEARRSMLERMEKSWEQYLWVLNTLSKNSQAQWNASLHSVDLKRGDETDDPF